MLIAAADNYDPGRAVTSGAYVRARVRGTILNSIRRDAPANNPFNGVNRVAEGDAQVDRADSRPLQNRAFEVSEALTRLTTVIELRMAGFTHVEIGRQLGISGSGAQRLEARARWWLAVGGDSWPSPDIACNRKLRQVSFLPELHQTL